MTTNRPDEAHLPHLVQRRLALYRWQLEEERSQAKERDAIIAGLRAELAALREDRPLHERVMEAARCNVVEEVDDPPEWDRPPPCYLVSGVGCACPGASHPLPGVMVHDVETRCAECYAAYALAMELEPEQATTGPAGDDLPMPCAIASAFPKEPLADREFNEGLRAHRKRAAVRDWYATSHCAGQPPTGGVLRTLWAILRGGI